MADHRYTHTLSLSIGGDTPSWEGEATVSYLVSWGAPEQGPSYASGGQPADPDEIDDITITHIDGVPVTVCDYGKYEAETLEMHIECSDALMDELMVAACKQAAADYADEMDYRAEQRREASW
jgi:hypothetical protein